MLSRGDLVQYGVTVEILLQQITCILFLIIPSPTTEMAIDMQITC